MTAFYVGLDVGGREIHGVALGADNYVVGHLAVKPNAADRLLERAAGAAAIAIDSPDRLSSAPQGADPNPDIPPKFRKAGCAEFGLLKLYGLQVPWATPTREPVDAWMRVGIHLFDVLRHAGHDPAEVSPTRHSAGSPANYGPAQKGDEGSGRKRRRGCQAKSG